MLQACRATPLEVYDATLGGLPPYSLLQQVGHSNEWWLCSLLTTIGPEPHLLALRSKQTHGGAYRETKDHMVLSSCEART